MKLGVLAACLLLVVPVAFADYFNTAGPYVPGPPGPSPRVDEYQYDDGSSENSLGLTAGGDIAMLHMFDPIGGLQTITDIRAAWGTPQYPGSSPPAGTPVQVYVWDDVNNDGDPSDGVVIAQGSGTVQNPDTDILNTYALNSPVTVNSRFFIGAVVSQVAGEFPLPMDQSQASAGRAWVVGNSVMGGFDPNNLPGNGIGPYEMDSIGFPSVFLLRANAVPEPATLTLLALGALALRRR